MSVNLSKMAWSSRSHRLSIVVLVFARQMKPGRRDGIVVTVKGRVLPMHVCLRKSSGWDVCGSLEDCFENTERQRRSITTCTITCTWRPRVMCLRTRECWWNTSIGRRPRSNVLNSSGWFYSVALYFMLYSLSAFVCYDLPSWWYEALPAIRSPKGFRASGLRA